MQHAEGQTCNVFSYSQLQSVEQEQLLSFSELLTLVSLTVPDVSAPESSASDSGSGKAKSWTAESAACVSTD